MRENNETLKEFIPILEDAIANKKSFLHLRTLMDDFSIAENVTANELSRIYKILYSFLLKDYFIEDDDELSLYWISEQWFEQTLFDRCAWNRRTIRKRIERDKKRGQPYKTEEEIAKQFNYPPVITCPWTATQAYQELLPYFNFMQQQIVEDPTVHFKISWDILEEAPEPILKAFKKWWLVLEKEKLVEYNFTVNIEEAHYWHQKNAKGNLNREDFNRLFDLLDSENAVLRAVAAKCLGNTYGSKSWYRRNSEFCGESEIPLTEMMEIIYKKQIKGQNVAGGFIDGMSDCASGMHMVEKHKTLVKENFDFKEWVLKVAIDSTAYEPYIPGSQAFWFYVHEYLDFDPVSVQRLINSKKYWLAMMCATESPEAFKEMKPILENLIEVADESISDPVKSYIKTMEEIFIE